MNILYVDKPATDPSFRFLSSQKKAKEYDKIIFKSYYQLETFRRTLGLDYNNLNVIEPGIEPFSNIMRDYKSNVNVSYTMPAHHGLHILMPVFKALNEKYENKIFLDILDDFEYEPLQDKLDKLKKECEETKNVQVHDKGSVYHVLEHSDIWTYPTIWENIECPMLASAMSARNICVHPAYGVLPEISGNLTVMYDMVTENDKQASVLYQTLDTICNAFLDKESFKVVQQRTQLIKAYADTRYDTNLEQARLNNLTQENTNDD